MEERRYKRAKPRKRERETVVLVTLKYNPDDYSPKSVETLVHDKLADGMPFILEDVETRTLRKDEIRKLNEDSDVEDIFDAVIEAAVKMRVTLEWIAHRASRPKGFDSLSACHMIERMARRTLKKLPATVRAEGDD